MRRQCTPMETLDVGKRIWREMKIALMPTDRMLLKTGNCQIESEPVYVMQSTPRATRSDRKILSINLSLLYNSFIIYFEKTIANEMTTVIPLGVSTLTAATPERFEPGKRLRGPKRRQQVLACALLVFSRDGIGRAGHTQVAELAGVSVTTVFKYFPNRKALVDAVLGKVERRLLKLVQEAHAEAPSAREALHAQVRAWTRLAREEPDVMKIWLEWSASIRDEVWPRYLKLENRVNRIIVDTLERDPTPRRIKDIDAARAAHSTAHMFAHMIFSPDGAFDEAEKFMLDAIDVLIGFEEGAPSPQDPAK